MQALGSVMSLHIALTGAAPMLTVSQVRAIAGLGLEGDRYFAGAGTYSKDPGSGRHVTLIESEAIEGLKREYGVEIAPNQTRRNIVTRGAALNHLVDREFFVGPVRLRGMRLCEPCTQLERLSARGALRGLIHRGGLRAEILTGGIIEIGDAIAAGAELR
ncbi:MAG: MOSC domain-containing protein [Chloroflexota bacterium]